MSKIKNVTAKGISMVCGDLHLIAKSSADGIANTEAYFVNKLTGRAKAHIIEDRHNKTEQTQELIKAMPGLIGASVRGMMSRSKKAAKEDNLEAEVSGATSVI